MTPPRGSDMLKELIQISPQRWTGADWTGEHLPPPKPEAFGQVGIFIREASHNWGQEPSAQGRT